MKKNSYVFFVFFILVSFDTYSQKSANVQLFNQYINKFKTCTFPISDDIFIKNNLYANNTGNLSKKEFETFIFDKADTFWEYKNYSNTNKKKFFNYVAGIKFYFYENYVGTIVLRAFFSDDMFSEKTESNLCVFNKSGIKISSLAISGVYGDTLTFDSKIYSPEKIEVNYTKYSEKGEKKYSKYYCIQKDGKIVLKK